MTSVAYGIAMPASRGVLTGAPPPSWLPAGATVFADVPNGRYWAARRVWPDFAGWLAAAGAAFSGAAGRYYATSGHMLAAAALDVPRAGHYLGGVPHLLYEPAATNKALYSGNQSNAAWGSSKSAKGGTATGPDGAASLYAFVPAAGSNLYAGGYNVTPYSGTGVAVTQSWFVKFGDFRWFAVTFGAGTPDSVWFDLQNGVVATQKAGSAGGIRPLANGVYRVSVTRTVAAAASYYNQFYVSDADNSGSATGDGSKAIYVGLAQSEDGASASSYVPTAAAAATRAAESISGIMVPGSLSVTFDDGSTQTIAAAAFATPANLNRPTIARIAG
jgi:hypothetical protein